MNYKEVIRTELIYWQNAYPDQKELLEKFANKIKLEIEMQTELDGDEDELAKIIHESIVGEEQGEGK